MIIGLYGRTDKRPLAYPLLKVLQVYGDVCFITRNKQYLRLSDTRESGGHYQNVMIIATDLSYDEIWEEVGYRTSDFKFVIYDMYDEIPDGLDLTIVCRTVVKESDEDEMLDWIESEKEEVRFEYEPAKGFFGSLFKKKIDNLPELSLSLEMWRFIEISEACRFIPKVPRCGIEQMFNGKLGEVLDLNSNSVLTLLEEGEAV